MSKKYEVIYDIKIGTLIDVTKKPVHPSEIDEKAAVWVAQQLTFIIELINKEFEAINKRIDKMETIR